MLECFEFAANESGLSASDSVQLNYQQRQKSRGKATTDNGETVSWFLEHSRGYALAHGDKLVSKNHTVVEIQAAPEMLSVIESTDALLLARAAYHLGNRHVPLQIKPGQLSYQHDHVLDGMVRGLGLAVSCKDSPFHPESGAYHSHSESTSHTHSHSHSHSAGHDHSHA